MPLHQFTVSARVTPAARRSLPPTSRPAPPLALRALGRLAPLALTLALLACSGAKTDGPHSPSGSGGSAGDSGRVTSGDPSAGSAGDARSVDPAEPADEDIEVPPAP